MIVRVFSNSKRKSLRRGAWRQGICVLLSVLLLFSVTACGKKDGAGTDSAESGNTGAEAAQAAPGGNSTGKGKEAASAGQTGQEIEIPEKPRKTEDGGISMDVFAMDTYMTLLAYGENAEEAILAAAAEIHRLDDLLSTGNPESEISKLNAAGGGTISADVEALIARAKEIHTETGGLFDISIYPVMRLWGFPTQEYRVPDKTEIAETLKLVDAAQITVAEVPVATAPDAAQTAAPAEGTTPAAEVTDPAAAQEAAPVDAAATPAETTPAEGAEPAAAPAEETAPAAEQGTAAPESAPAAQPAEGSGEAAGESVPAADGAAQGSAKETGKMVARAASPVTVQVQAAAPQNIYVKAASAENTEAAPAAEGTAPAAEETTPAAEGTAPSAEAAENTEPVTGEAAPAADAAAPAETVPAAETPAAPAADAAAAETVTSAETPADAAAPAAENAAQAQTAAAAVPVETEKKVSFGITGMEIDLGGIAKGYTSSRVMDIFREHGVKHGLVSLGGNVQAIGTKKNGKPWRVAIQNPESEMEYLGVLNIEDKCVITSGGYERFFEKDGVHYHHIIDPRTGYPADSGLISATIISEDGALADGLSTSLFIMGKDEAEKYWREHADDFDYILEDKDGTLYVTEGADEILTTDNRTIVIRK